MLYEFKKSTGKLWKFVICFFLINAIICIWVTREDPRLIPQDIISEFFDIYADNSIQMNEEYHLGVSRSPEIRKYAPEGFSDWHLFQEIYSRVDHIEGYQASIQSVIDNAQNRLDSTSGYLHKYYTSIIERYSYVKANTIMGLEHTRGWISYFSYRAGDLLLLFMIIIISSTTFTQEKTSGFMPILRSSLNGRTKTAIQKIAATVSLVFLLFLLFTAETWIIFYLRTGFSSMSNAIQVFSPLKMCPYVISVGQYFFITISIRAFIFVVFSLIIMLISVFVYNYVVIFLSGLGIIGLNYFLYLTRYLNADNIFANVNLFSAISITPLFSKYRTFNFFGHPISQLSILFVIVSILIIFSIPITIHKYSSGANIVLLSWQTAAKDFVIDIKKSFATPIISKTSNNSRNLFTTETYKTLLSSRLFILIIVLFIAKLLISSSIYETPVAYSDAVYKEYMQAVAGEVTDEKRMYLINERKKINETRAMYDYMQSQYIDGLLTIEEYHQYLSEYNYAYSRDIYLKRVEDHLVYIDQMQSQKKDAWFVYDTGWKQLFFPSFDWTLYVCVVALFGGIFASEHNNTSSSGCFSALLRTTKYGRQKTFFTKYFSSVVIGITLFIAWSIVDLTLILCSYDMPLISAPVYSLQTMKSFPFTVTIFQYCIIMYAIRLLILIIFILCICSLSQLLKRQIIILTVIVVATIIPELLVYFGLLKLDMFNFVSLMKVTPIFLSDIPIVFYIALSILLSSLLTYRAERTWTK